MSENPESTDTPQAESGTSEADADHSGDTASPEAAPEVVYEVLCRAHHRRRMTAARARAVSMIAEPLPFA